MPSLWRTWGAPVAVAAILAAGCAISTARPVDGGVDGTGASTVAPDAPDAVSPAVCTLPPVPFDDFCAQFVGSVCALRERCACGDAAVGGDCEANLGERCTWLYGGADVRSAVDAGLLVYDPVAAARLIARMECGSTDCRVTGEALGFTLRNRPSLAGVLTGTVAPDASCSQPDIGVQVCAGMNACTSGVCQPAWTSLGDPCDPMFATSYFCVDPDALVDHAVPAGGYCSPGTSTCVRYGAPGEPCRHLGECLTRGCVAGACTPPAGDGAACEVFEQCASGFCESGVCTTRRPGAPGEVCDVASDCALGTCAPSHRCRPCCAIPLSDRRSRPPAPLRSSAPRRRHLLRLPVAGHRLRRFHDGTSPSIIPMPDAEREVHACERPFVRTTLFGPSGAKPVGGRGQHCCSVVCGTNPARQQTCVRTPSSA